MGGHEPSPEDGGVDIVEASFDVQEEGGALQSRSLEGLISCLRALQASEKLSPGREPN